MTVCSACAERPRVRIASGLIEAAAALGVSPRDLAIIVSYETAGSFDPLKRGPTTQWGQHRGLIQFGEPQAIQYGVDWDDPIDSQVGAGGAIVRYMLHAGVRPGHGLLDLYSAVNAGYVGRYDRTDENNGGAAGTVREKVDRMVDREGHGANADRLLAEAASCACLDRSSGDSVIVLGDQTMSECLRRAGLWSIRAYHNPPENVAPVLRPDYARLDTGWDILWDMGLAATGASPENKQDVAAATGAASPGVDGSTITDPAIVGADSGFYAILAQPKGEYSERTPQCPPVLAFRGSEFQSDEFRGLAIGLRLRMENVLRTRDGTGAFASERVLSRMTVSWPFHIGSGWEEDVRDAGPVVVHEPTGWERFVDRLSAAPEIADALSTAWTATDLDFLPDAGPLNDHLAQSIGALGLPEVQTVLQSDDMWRNEPQGWLMRRVESMMGGEFWGRYSAVVSLHYSEDGDWAANVAQAMGLVGTQYEQVKTAVDEAIPTARSRGNRLNITGHSLGGGLAQAAAVYCRHAYPDIRIGCQIFNASGLHEKTAERLHPNASRSDGLEIPIFCKQVAGELLTTAQSPGGFPLVWDIFRWQGVTIPSAIGVPDQRRAVSPGPFPVGGDHQISFVDPLPPYPNSGYATEHVRDGGDLPFVFPLRTQDRFTSPNYTMEVRTLTPSGGGNTGSGSALGGTAPMVLRERSALEAMADGDGLQVQDEVYGNEILQRRPATPVPLAFPHLDAISGIANNAPDFDTFAGETVTYLLNAVGEDTAERGWIERLSPAADLVRVVQGVRTTAGELSEEIERAGTLFSISAAYHPMDIGGSTFLRPPEEEQ